MFHGNRFQICAVTTTLEMATDRPLAAKQSLGASWKLGLGTNAKNARNSDPFRTRNFADGPHPFERLKRVENPTTYIDAVNVARVPKRANMFARSLFGDLGKKVQDSSKNGK